MQRFYQDGDGMLRPYETTVWHDRIGALVAICGAIVYYPVAWCATQLALCLWRGEADKDANFRSH